MAFIAKDSTDYHSILLNSSLSFPEKNFYGTHELIHIYTNTDNPGQSFNCYDTVKPDQNSYIEWIANEGAAELLVSYKLLLPMIKENYINMITDLGTYEFCEKNADLFNVTPTVLQNRIISLKYEIHQYLNGTNINDIQILSKNAQERKCIFVKSLIELENERLSNWLLNFKRPVSTLQDRR